jgi:hypothetical protein
MKLSFLVFALVVLALSTILLVVSLTDIVRSGFLKEYRTVIGLTFLLCANLAGFAFRKYKAG